MSSNTVPLPTGRRRSMHPIYPHTHWKSSCFSQLMVPTLGMANYTNRLQLTHSRRLAFTGSTILNSSRYPPTSSQLTRFGISIGQATQNWMMIYSHFLGCQKRNGVIISQVIQNLNPPSHVHRTTSICTNALHSNNSSTQHSHSVRHTEFQQTPLYFQQYWYQWSLRVASCPSCVAGFHVLIPFMPLRWLFPCWILHMSFCWLTVQCD